MKMEAKILDQNKDIQIFDNCIELSIQQILMKKVHRYNKDDTILWLKTFRKDFLNGSMIVSYLSQENKPLGFYCALKCEMPYYFLRYIAFFEKIQNKFNYKMDLIDKPVLDKLENLGFYSGIYLRTLNKRYIDLDPIEIFNKHDMLWNQQNRYDTYIEHIIYNQSQFEELSKKSTYKDFIPKKFVDPIIVYTHRLKNEFRKFQNTANK